MTISGLEKVTPPKNMNIEGCPFCGSDNIQMFKDSLFDSDTRIGFYCTKCDMIVETPYANRKIAVIYWNSRV